METLFLTVLHMSVIASKVMILVLLARLVLWKAPKVFSYALWAVVLLRLLCPVTIKSNLSIISNYPDTYPNILSDIYSIYVETDKPVLLQGLDSPPNSVPLNPTRIASGLWLAGVAAILGHSIWSMGKLRRKLKVSIPLEGENDVRLVDHIPIPFVLGLFSPKIYLPSDLPESEREYILLHERTHIRRLDHITRSLAWLALAVHWFNPLVWLAFCLASKDMEMSCDEAVLRKMGGRRIQADYSTSLLRLSAGGRLPAGPLAFGGRGLKRRVKNILNYRKPALWVLALAFVAVAAVGTALATDPGGFIDPDLVASYTQISATSSPSTRRGIVYTAADRRQDLLNPTDSLEMRKEDGDEMVRLLNSYRRTVYGRGELELYGPEHHLFRISCVDGGYYLVDYWYWKSFSFNPLHGGEDSYTTLVTRYDAKGNAGTTWQMEYDFDPAFKDWWFSLPERMINLLTTKVITRN